MNDSNTTHTPSVAIVILNWNGSEMMRRYLPNVIDCSKDEAEVIIADNHSSDDSLAMLKENFPSLRTITLDDNYGFAEGYNRALRQVEADYYVLLNSDVEVTPHWLCPILAYMEYHPECAVTQPKLLALKQRDTFEYAGASGGMLDYLGYPFCRGRIFNTLEKDHGQYDTPYPLAWATGACLVIRRADYWNAGGLDGRFFAHNEEIDLCWRLHQMGKRIYCFPESEVYHLGGGTLPKTNSKKTFLNFRNNLTMLYKNLPDNELKKVMRVRWFLDYLAAFETLLINHNLADFRAIFQARKAFKKWRKNFDADRAKLKKDIEKSHTEASELGMTFLPDGRRSFSILKEYYLRGHHRYSQLPE